MAKKKILKQEEITLSLPLPEFTIWCMVGKRFLLPSCAFDKRYWNTLQKCKTQADMECVKNATWKTYDGKLVKVKFISTINNQGNKEINRLDKLSREIFGNNIDFPKLKEAWYKRNGTNEDFWHIVELEEI